MADGSEHEEDLALHRPRARYLRIARRLLDYLLVISLVREDRRQQLLIRGDVARRGGDHRSL
jgi:hypothetical protein